MSMAQLLSPKLSGKSAAFAVTLTLALGAVESAGAVTRLPNTNSATLSGATAAGELLRPAHQQKRPWWQHPAGRKGVKPHHFHSRRHYQPHRARPHIVGRGCHPATVIGYHYGRKVLFGSVVCFNRYGQAYVVPGSRHLIRHLYR
ncbi:MAG: hypothetical protein ACFCUT_13885 [Kiloniellaceae bacterium]